MHVASEVSCVLPKIVRLQDNYLKYGTSRQALRHRTQYGGKKIRFACRITKTKVRTVIIFSIYWIRLDEILRLSCKLYEV